MNDGRVFEPESDDDLVARIAGGDQEALSALFTRRSPTVLRFALRITGVRATAEDITQDVFLTVIRLAHRYKPGRSSVVAWLCGIARNHARHRRRRDRTVPPDQLPSVAQRCTVASDPAEALEKTEDVEALRAAILSLPMRYREVVVLCGLQQLSYEEAADALGCAVGTVRSRLHRGRTLLARKLYPTTKPAKAARARCVV